MQENVNEKLYYEIDTWKYRKYGEVALVKGPMTAYEIAKDTPDAPKGNFSITREKELISSINCLRGKMGTLFAYILEHRDPYNQMLYKPKKISVATSMSERAVIENLRYFEKQDMIARDEESLMIHPGIIHRGNRLREIRLIDNFKKMQKAWRSGGAENGEMEVREDVVRESDA